MEVKNGRKLDEVKRHFFSIAEKTEDKSLVEIAVFECEPARCFSGVPFDTLLTRVLKLIESRLKVMHKLISFRFGRC